MAVRSRAPGEITPLRDRVSDEFLEWRRNQAEQDYQAGRIDKAKHDSDLAIIQDLKEQLAVEAAQQQAAEFYKSLDERVTREKSTIQKLREVVQRGDPKDLDRLARALRDAIEAERDSQLMGRPESELMQRLKEMVDTYAEGVLRNCDKRRDLGPETAKFMLDFERMRQLGGTDDAKGLERCLYREWSGAAQIESNYGPVSVKIRKTGCSQGIFGNYVYEVSGAVTGSFEFEAKEPRDNFVTFTPFTLRAKVAPRWTDRTYSCSQSGELAIGAPPGAFFQATTRSGTCEGTDDLGSVAIVETTAIRMSAGALCE